LTRYSPAAGQAIIDHPGLTIRKEESLGGRLIEGVESGLS
jgi:hypothetical protein